MRDRWGWRLYFHTACLNVPASATNRKKASSSSSSSSSASGVLKDELAAPLMHSWCLYSQFSVRRCILACKWHKLMFQGPMKCNYFVCRTQLFFFKFHSNCVFNRSYIFHETVMLLTPLLKHSGVQSQPSASVDRTCITVRNWQQRLLLVLYNWHQVS